MPLPANDVPRTRVHESVGFRWRYVRIVNHGRRISALVIASAAASVIAGPTAALADPATPLSLHDQVVPQSGGQGTVVTISPLDPCPITNQALKPTVALQFSQAEGSFAPTMFVPVGADGRWFARITMPGPPTIYSRGLEIYASCQAGGQTIGSYTGQSFEYTGPLNGPGGSVTGPPTTAGGRLPSGAGRPPSAGATVTDATTGLPSTGGNEALALSGALTLAGGLALGWRRRRAAEHAPTTNLSP